MERPAATISVAACAVTVVLVAIPYLLALPQTVAVYYRVTPVGPLLVALFAVLAAVVVSAGHTGRTDRNTAAGVGVTLGVFLAATSWWWALSVDSAAVASVSPLDAFRYHRWTLGVVATVVALATGGYARAVLGTSAPRSS